MNKAQNREVLIKWNALVITLKTQKVRVALKTMKGFILIYRTEYSQQARQASQSEHAKCANGKIQTYSEITDTTLGKIKQKNETLGVIYVVDRLVILCR